MEEFLGRGIGGRSSLIWRGIASVIFVALLLAFATAYAKGDFSDTVQVDAVVKDAGGSLVPGADVKARGVQVGKASKISLTGDVVHIRLTLDKKTIGTIPSNVTARILPATVFGTSFVELVIPTHPDGRTLQAGQRISQDTSEGTLELQTTLDSLYRVVTAVHPAELSTTLAAVSTALTGHGDELGQSMETLDNYLTRLNPHLPLLQQDIAMLATNLENLDRHTPELFSAVDDGLVTLRTITEKKAQLTTLLTGSGALVSEADRFLTDEEQPIIDTIRQSAVMVDALYDQRAGIAPGFRAFVAFGKNGISALSSGPFLNTDTRIITTNSTPYTSADCPRYGSAHGDNCPEGGSGGASVAASVPGIDDALVARMQSMLKQLDTGGKGGVGELLSRPLIGDSWGEAQ